MSLFPFILKHFELQSLYKRYNKIKIIMFIVSNSVATVIMVAKIVVIIRTGAANF